LDVFDCQDRKRKKTGCQQSEVYKLCYQQPEKGLVMKAVFIMLVMLLVFITGLGFYQGWFHFSTDSTDQKSSATVTIDKNKIQADEEKVKEKVGGVGQKTNDKTGDRTY